MGAPTSCSPALRVEHRAFLPFSLPQNADTANFLDELLRPFLEPRFLQHALAAADECWPHPLPVPQAAKNFVVYVEGDINAYDPGVLRKYTGDPESFLKLALSEAVGNKQKANRLAEHRPNVLAINYLLGSDFYMAEQRQQELQEKMPTINRGSTLDAILSTCTGVDGELREVTVAAPNTAHPLVAWLQRQGIITSRGFRSGLES